LPKAEQEAAPWQLATDPLMLIAERGDDLMMENTVGPPMKRRQGSTT
jgi:hypothetical protein